MQVDIRISALGADDPAEYVLSCEKPAMLLGSDLKLIVKNKPATGMFRGIRTGRSIKCFLPKDGEDMLLDMKEGQIAFLTLTGRGPSDANVLKGKDYWLITADPGIKDIKDELDRIYEKSSGYDVPLTAFGLNEIRGRALFQSVLLRLPCYRRKEQTAAFYFDASLILQSIKREVSRKSFEPKRKITLFGAAQERITCGSEKDYAIIAIYLLQLCFRLADDDKTDISIFEEQNRLNLIFDVSTPTPLSELTGDKNSVSSPLNGEGYWLYLIKLLAEGNLWEFRIDSVSENRIQFTLSTPVATPSEDCMLRDVSPEYLHKLISYIFSEFK